ncbi:MAG TPA: hypothetical protein VHQ86_02860 [Candidatus Saccharimonadia bacterium]|jgi:hypothetical protein|nr:hypothetical protein [Candidatus Saccharimonadia bacterium]
MPPATPPAPNPTPPPPKPPKPSLFKELLSFKGGNGWTQIKTRATTIGAITGLFAFLVSIGLIAGYYYSQSQKKPPATSSNNVTTLTPDEINRLGQVGTSLGGNGQTLNIGADTIIRGKTDISGDLSVGGHFSANGPVTLSELNISGSTAVTGLNVGSNLNVSGTALFQKGLTVTGLATVSGNLSVSGTASITSINATSLSVRDLTITGPLLISHITTQGPPPTLTAGTAVGGGGTVSISGNDTAGTVNFNIGSSPPAGVLGTITFRAAYGTTVHVQLTPLSGAAASTPAYVTRSAAGFTVHTDSPPAAGTLSFDYLVTQ